MKKFLSVLAGGAMLLNLSPFYSNSSENGEVDLNSLAASLGADTDFLNVVNYSHNILEDDLEEVYLEHRSKYSVIEASNSNIYTVNVIMNYVEEGSSMGISLLEILSHNGVIFPSDIQDGVDSLSEISLNDEIDRIITLYQVSQGYTEFNNYKGYLLTTQTYEQQIENLISTAERCTADERYFLISIRTADMNHNVCGIGIAEGEWEWNGKSYDKCILTLDSNNADNEGNAVGFREETCIYINSDTMESCIPAYDLDMDDEPDYAAIDDDSLLNYKGAIKPSVEINSDKSYLTHFQYRPGDYLTTYSVKNGEKTPFDRADFGTKKGPAVLSDFDYIRVEMDGEYEKFLNFRYSNPDRWIDVEFQDLVHQQYADYNGTLEMNNDFVRVVNEGDMPIDSFIQIRMNEGTYDFSPYFSWLLSGYIAEDFTVEIVEDGMLLRSSGRIDMNVTPSRFISTIDGEFQFANGNLLIGYTEKENSPAENNILVTINDENKVVFYADKDNDGIYEEELGVGDMSDINSCRITADNDVLITVNEENRIVCYIDDNGDDVFDTPVVKGDANYDGAINSADASTILSHYAKASTSSSRINTDYFTMDFNNDSYVNSADASAILEYYAKIQTN